MPFVEVKCLNRKMKYFTFGLLAIALLLPSISSVAAQRPDDWKGVGRSTSGLFIYVKNQELYYDSIVTADPLPFNEDNAETFQELFGAGYGAPHWTMYGPGDPEYNGGKWWLDLNDNDIMDPEGTDHYFSCPLQGPGRMVP
jgi:hypothetical protein